MFTTRISPKMSANPLATVNNSPAKVIESIRMLRNVPKSWTAEPLEVVRQLPVLDPSGFVMNRM